MDTGVKKILCRHCGGVTQVIGDNQAEKYRNIKALRMIGVESIEVGDTMAMCECGASKLYSGDEIRVGNVLWGIEWRHNIGACVIRVLSVSEDQLVLWD